MKQTLNDHVNNLEHENKHLKRSIDWLSITVILQIILVVLLIIYFTV